MKTRPDPSYRKSMLHVARAQDKLTQSAKEATKATRKFAKALKPRKPKMSRADFLSFFPATSGGRGMDYRANKATNKGHIHKHNPTWLPKTRIALTKAHKRRILAGLIKLGAAKVRKGLKASR